MLFIGVIVVLQNLNSPSLLISFVQVCLQNFEISAFRLGILPSLDQNYLAWSSEKLMQPLPA